MKSTYAIAMLALLILGVGGSVLGYNVAVNKMHAHEEGHAGEGGGHDAAGAGHAAETSAAETPTEGAEAVADDEAVASEEAGTEDVGADTQEANVAEGAAPVAASGNVDNGKTLYAAQCAGCHGAGGEGGLGPAMNNAAGWSDAEFLKALRTGDAPSGQLKAPMMQYGEAQLSDSDVSDIHAFIGTL